MAISRILTISFILLVILAYFIFHTIYGEKGLVAKSDLENEIKTSSKELEKIRSNRIGLEHKVKLLRGESLDKDSLEEEAKRILGVAKATEEVIVNKEDAISE